MAGEQHLVQTILEGRGLSKSFSGVPVLTDVTVRCNSGVTLALVGENGAGKSTLVNILSGVLQPTSGQVFVDGQRVVFRTPQDAKRYGIHVVHQELSLLPYLTVAENLFLANEPVNRMGWFRNRRIHHLAAELLEELEVAIQPSRLVSSLSPAERQMVEIVRACSHKPRVLFLDEPTSSLSGTEVEKLFGLVNSLKRSGTSVVFISHRLDEILEFCDEITVLKDGVLVVTRPVAGLDRNTLIQLMVGREVRNTFPAKSPIKAGERSAVSIHRLTQAGAFTDVSMEVPQGHIVGIGGLEGQGQRELARALFGLSPHQSGSIQLHGQEVRIRSPRDAIRRGVVFVPDDRKEEGLVLPLSVRENIVLATLHQISRWGVIRRRAERQQVADNIRELAVKAASMDIKVRSLSGGNQQKVIFSKWLRVKPRVLILHEPTRGIDVQSKIEIYQLLRRLTADGVSVILITSDMLELIGLSDRVYVMYEGRVTGQLEGEDITEQNIMSLAVGHSLIKEGAAGV